MTAILSTILTTESLKQKAVWHLQASTSSAKRSLAARAAIKNLITICLCSPTPLYARTRQNSSISGDAKSAGSEWSLAQSEPPSLAHKQRTKLGGHLEKPIPSEIVYIRHQDSLDVFLWEETSKGRSDTPDTVYSDEGDDSELPMTAFEEEKEEPLSPEAAKKRRLWKLRRQLGQSVPPEVVYGEDAALMKRMLDAYGTRKSRTSYEWEEDSGFGEDEVSEDGLEIMVGDLGTTPKQGGFKHSEADVAFVGGWYREQRGKRWAAESDCRDIIEALRKL
ncbi:hypothetical protein HWV62_24964 [Athelia sp. TMB]|nr:hypothetical protein HWV62_24964 [Athelia sp. TMB]